MIPTATFRGVVHDPSGKPVEGASVMFWPNVGWSCGYSQISLDREFAGITDASGVVVVANLPPGSEDFVLQHADWHLPLVERWGRREPYGTVELVAGETAELSLAVIASR